MYYHCSERIGLKVLEPGKPKYFDKPSFVYMTMSLPMALMYGIKNFEYTYGYTKAGLIYYEEYFPNALEELYAGKQASLYTCAPEETEVTLIPNEVVSAAPVRILSERRIPDLLEALLEQERLGNLAIRRYHTLPEKSLEWIQSMEAEEIRQRNLLKTGGPMAAYMKRRYPKSWEMAEGDSHE